MDFMNGNRQQPPAEWLTAPGPESRRWMGACVRSHESVHWFWTISSGPVHHITPHQITSHQAPEPSCDLTRLYSLKAIKWIIGKAPFTPRPSSKSRKRQPRSVCPTPKTEPLPSADCTCSLPSKSWFFIPEADRGDESGFNTKTQQPPPLLLSSSSSSSAPGGLLLFSWCSPLSLDSSGSWKDSARCLIRRVRMIQTR